MRAGVNRPPQRAQEQLHQLVGRLFESDAVAAAEHGVPDALLPWMKRNKYPVLSLVPNAPDSLVQDPAIQSAIAVEREWYDTQREEYLRVRQAWLDQGIPCLMIKSAGNTPAFPHLSDNLDLSVPPAHGRAARETLRRLGYVELRNVEEPLKYLFRKFRDGRCVAAIHVHEQVGWEVGFMDETSLWARMRTAEDDPCVNIPSPEDSILINLAHACYENKRLRFNDCARVRFSLRSLPGQADWAYMERVAASRGWLDGLAFMLLVYAAVEPEIFGSSLIPTTQQAHLESIVRADPKTWRRLEAIRAAASHELPLDLSYWFCKRMYYRKVLADPTLTTGERWRDVASTLATGVKLKLGIHPQPGMVVSLSGVDGSGKSAHARALVDELRVCGIETDYRWSRGGSAGLLRLVSKLRGTAKRSSGSTDPHVDSIARRKQSLGNPVVQFGWAWAVAADQIATYALRAAIPAALGRVVVCDRYAYDAAVEMDATLPREAHASRLAIAALLALVRRPDIGYVFDVSLETAQARKTDEGFHANREAQRAAYRMLAETYGLRQISTEGDFAESNDPLIREVMTELMSNFETWLNALFHGNPSQYNPPDPIWARATR